MQAPIRSFNRKHSRTYNTRIQRRNQRRSHPVEEYAKEPINHSGNSYIAANFLRTVLENDGFIDRAELTEEVSRYVGHQGGHTPPLNRVKRELPDYLFSIITRMPYYDELARSYRDSGTSEISGEII